MTQIIVAGISIIGILITNICNLVINSKNIRKQEFEKEINQVQIDNCKNYLVQAIAKADSKGLTKVEQERYFENYDKYIELGGNSYIHAETERLKREGKI